MILLVGPSASGKTEIAKNLGVLFGIKKAVTHTTRAPRIGETNHIDYHFVSEEEFLSLKKADAFVETTFYNNRHYGCSKAEISDDKVVVVDPNGMVSFLALQDPSIIVFSLVCDESIRYERMRSRGDQEKAIVGRIENDRVDFASEILKRADFTIDTSEKDIDSLTKEIYALYKEILAKRKSA